MYTCVCVCLNYSYLGCNAQYFAWERPLMSAAERWLQPFIHWGWRAVSEWLTHPDECFLTDILVLSLCMLFIHPPLWLHHFVCSPHSITVSLCRSLSLFVLACLPTSHSLPDALPLLPSLCTPWGWWLSLIAWGLWGPLTKIQVLFWGLSH